MAEPDTDLETVVAPVSDRDAVDNDVRAAIASLKGDDAAAAEIPGDKAPVADAPEKDAAAPPVVKADHPTDPKRYADGSFKPKTEAAPVKAAPDPKLPATEEPTKASAAPSTAVAPPVSWAADAKAMWATLPPAIQTAVLKREREASDGIGQYSERTKAYERALAPVAQEAQRFGLNVEDGIKRLLDGQRFLETQPAQAIMWLAQKHNLNLADIASNPPAPQMPVRTDPVVPPEFIQHVSSLEERLNGFFMDQNMTAVQQFAADPKHFHYADVEPELPEIMEVLRARDPALKGVPLLQKAYDLAVRSNEAVQGKIEADRKTQTLAADAAKLAEKSARAGKAAISVKGSSADTRPPPRPNGAGSGHATDDVRAAIEQLRAG